MKLLFSALLSLWVLGLCLAASKRGLRWCNTSKAEAAKCSKLRRNLKKVNGPLISCSRKPSHTDCIQAIAKNKADAMALDGRLLFEAIMDPYNLRPVAAEFSGPEANPETHFYAVAVVKKDSSFLLNKVQGVKSCHSAFNSSVGWDVPIGTVRLLLNWAGPSEPLQKAVAEFFSASCVPCADGKQYPNLCELCSGTGENKCACSSNEPYFGDSGALKCLKEGAGEVAFVASTVFETVQDRAERDQYELLCPDNTRKSVDEFKDCYLAQVPFHTIVGRRVKGNEDEIWNFLSQAQENFGIGKHPTFQLFDPTSAEKNLLFRDDSKGFLRIPSTMDAGLYLGSNYLKAVRGLRETAEEAESRRARVLWCAVGPKEASKCQQWSEQSAGKVTCATANTTEDCIALVLKGEADAMSLDGGFIYIAGKCGLVPVLAESRKSEKSGDSDCVNKPVEGYYAVAVVRKSNADLTWNSLKGKKSCHTAVGRTAGWNIPMGLLFKQTGSCRFDEFFSQSCAPGSDPNSNLCALCVGNDSGQDKCASNSNERYFGYNGAFRCLAENAGDVAFVKDTTVLENTNGKNSEAWAKDLNLEDFELLCLDGTRKPVTEAESCHLARSPSHGVVSQKDKVEHLELALLDQQARFGNGGSDCPSKFCLFQSETKNLLFNDNTECLAKLHGKTTYDKYLGQEYVTAVTHLRRCSISPLLETCNFLRRENPQ